MAAQKQIMVSYQWDSQKEVISIKDALEAIGYDIWMDLDDMRGNIYEKMAEGVENSVLIIPCMTSKYESSVNCRKEFQYSQDRRKPMIPLMMEKGYRPGGALGLIIAGMKYVDFSDSTKFDEKMLELQEEIRSFFEDDAPPVQDMKSLGLTRPEGDHKMKIGFVEARAGSWNGAADDIVGKIGKKNIKKGQLLGIDAHNNGKNENAIFTAFYDLNSPGNGELTLTYDVQNTGSSWNTIYTEASGHAQSVKLEDVKSMTASCNANKAVFYVFSQVPSLKVSECIVNFVESRGAWKTAADEIIALLSKDGAQNGQLLGIDAHNNGEDEVGIFSAFWSPDLPATGPLSIGFKEFGGSSAWSTYYANCASACNELKRRDFISITSSIDTVDTCITYLFYYQ